LSIRYFTSLQPLPFIEQVKLKLLGIYIATIFSAVTYVEHVLSVANQRMYLLAQLKSHGLSRDISHITLTQKLLPAIRSIAGDMFVFQQDYAHHI